MIADHLTAIKKSDADLWKIADNLRAKSGLASNEHCMPVTGLLFLCHATNRYYEAQAAIETDQATDKMPKRPLVKAAFVKLWQYGVPPDEGKARIADTNNSRQVEL